jgi:hypothetical protein
LDFELLCKVRCSVRKSFEVFSVLFFILFPFFFLTSSFVSAQTLFQNGNTSCESERVLCSSLTSGSCLGGDVQSIACKNVAGAADFNGDGFADCAAAFGDISSPTGTAPFPDVNVLINNGTGATACSDQFNPALNYVLNFDNTFLGSIVVGPLNGAGFDDLALPGVTPSGGTNGNSIVSALSQSGGGFGSNNSDITSPPSSVWLPSGATQEGFSSILTQPNMALFDCDNNGTLDAVLAVEEPFTAAMRFNILKNNGSGLQNITSATDSFFTGVSGTGTTNSGSASVAVADFNQDGNLDVALAIHIIGRTTVGEVTRISFVDVVTVCPNDGTCNFNCLPPIDLAANHSSSPTPFSIAAGDFNGDGNEDFVVSEPGLSNLPGDERGIHYFFGDGTNNFPTNLHVPISGPEDGGPTVLATGCFNNDGVTDVAVSYGLSKTPPLNVSVVTSNGLGGLNLPQSLAFGVNTRDMAGIDAADFDNQGGDDLIVLATDDNASERKAFVFMNTVETLSPNAGVDQTVALNTPITITDASCAFSPADPTTSAFSFLWTANPSTNTTLSNPTTLNPSFMTSVPGTYTLTLQCSSFIGCTPTQATDTMQITVPTGIVLPPGTSTQAGNFFGCDMLPSESKTLMGMMSLFLPLAIMMIWRKKDKRPQ